MKAKLLFIACCVLLTGCVENTARQMLPLPPAAPIGTLSGNPVFETADKWSFSRAVIRYPARNGSHTIQVGDYLLSALSVALRDSQVSDLRLTAFENESRIGLGLVGRLMMTLDVEVSCSVDGAVRSGRFKTKERYIGAANSGDYSPIPLVVNRKVGDSLFHEQLRPVMDEAVAAVVQQIAPNYPPRPRDSAPQPTAVRSQPNAASRARLWAAG